MSDTYREEIDGGKLGENRFFPDMRKNRFGERLKFAMKGMANTKLADICGVSESTIRSYLSERTTPTLTILETISTALDTPATWLVSGEVPSTMSKARETEVSTDGMGTKIPMYEVEAAAGAGSLISNENVVDYWYVPQSWLRLERLDHADLCIINTIGDSMTPHINHSDRLLVKLNINREKALEGVFVINLDGNLRVKRLEVSMFPHGYRVMSDNELYQEEFIPASEMHQRLYVIGEVVRVFGAPASQPSSHGASSCATQAPSPQIDTSIQRPGEGI